MLDTNQITLSEVGRSLQQLRLEADWDGPHEAASAYQHASPSVFKKAPAPRPYDHLIAIPAFSDLFLRHKHQDDLLWRLQFEAREAAKDAEQRRRAEAAAAEQQRLAAQRKSPFDLPVEIMAQVMLELDFTSRYNFARACKDTNTWVKSITQSWNVSTGDFGGAEHEARVVLGRRPDLVTQSAVTVIHDDVTAPRFMYRGWELAMLKRMTVAISNVGDKIRRLELHRIPLLNTDLLNLLIPQLPNLEYLGVFHCDLISLLDTRPLLQLIIQGRTPKSRPVQLDFYPSRADQAIKQVFFTMAIPCLLYDILPLAARHNTSLMAPHRAFPRYLRELKAHLTPALLAAIEQNLIDDIVVAHLSRMKRHLPEDANFYVDPQCNDGQLWQCVDAHHHAGSDTRGLLPGCFFPEQQLKLHRDEPQCWGCRYREDADIVKRRQGAETNDFAEVVDGWLRGDRAPRDVETLLRSAREGMERAETGKADESWLDFWARRREREEIARHVRLGHLKKGQTLKNLKGRHNWAKAKNW